MPEGVWRRKVSFVFRLLLLFFWAVLFAAGCGGGGSGSQTSNREGRQHVLDWLREWYLWYDQVPANLNPADYATPQEVLEAGRSPSLDRWSYITTASKMDAQLNTGTFTGIGIRTSHDPGGDVWIVEVMSGSPASQGGVVRGDKILAINGRSVAEINASEEGWSAAFGADGVGVQVSLELENGLGQTKTLTLAKATFVEDPIFLSKVVEHGGRKIGYVVYDFFTFASYTALEEVFTALKQQNLDDLVLDLRYNGGGLIYVAAFLSSYLRNAHAADIFAAFTYNAKHQDSNFNLNFLEIPENLGLSRLFVITAGTTCSAAEMVISGLMPYMQVVTVGSATCGKPLGMDIDYFDDLAMAAVTFSVANAQGFKDYYDGIPPTCPTTDDPTHPLGDPQEASLHAALNFATTGYCP